MNPFTVYPAIDIRGGRCVRLMQGDYDRETVYGDSPLEMAKVFSDAGADWLHLVDLDGAKKGEPSNVDAILEIRRHLDVKMQVGGGIRTKEDVSRYLQSGVDRVILGSSAISDPDFVKEMLSIFGRRIVIGIDARNGWAAAEGWTQTSEMKAEDLALKLVDGGVEVFVFTDISKDGTLEGPNTKAITNITDLTGKEVIASGGVSTLDDIKLLSEVGVSGAIIGRALYTKAFTLQEALKAVGK